MNKRPIETARDADLRLSVIALQRAARRAHELAIRTGTVLIVRDPQPAHVASTTPSADRVNEPEADYGDAP